jgi:hypothetical protein
MFPVLYTKGRAMAATMEIRENGHALYFVFSTPLTAQQLMDVMGKDADYRNSVPFKVHALINAEHTDFPPSVLRARSSPSIVHPRHGFCAIVGSTALVRTMADTIFKLTRNDQFKFFATEDDAWIFIREKIAVESRIPEHNK